MSLALVDLYSKEELKEIVDNSFHMKDVLKKIGYKTYSGRNNDTVKTRLKAYNISTEHFTHNISKPKISTKDIFIKNSEASQSTLRRNFLKGNYCVYKCSICGLEPIWNNKPLTLTLDHINGDNHDNRIDNLRWVCPNCDRQLDTFGFKNRKNYNIKPKNYCVDCGIEISPKSVYCKKCFSIHNQKVSRPNRDQLKYDIRYNSLLAVGQKYGVSTTTIKKWCNQYSLPMLKKIIRNTSDEGWNKEYWNDIPVVIKSPKIITKKVKMINAQTNEIIKIFDSLSDAERFLNKPKATAHISQVCNHIRKTAFGYKWEFA